MQFHFTPFHSFIALQKPTPANPDARIIAQIIVQFITQCSTVCLPGERSLDYTCQRTNELGEIEEVSDIQCEYEPKLPLTEPCNVDNPCKGT